MNSVVESVLPCRSASARPDVFHSHLQQIIAAVEDMLRQPRLQSSTLSDLRLRYKTAILSSAWPSARDAFDEFFRLGDVVDKMIINKGDNEPT